MDQMPVPIAPAPPSSQTARVQPRAAVTRPARSRAAYDARSEEHTSELQSRLHLVCRLLLEKKKTNNRRRSPGAQPQSTALYRLISVLLSSHRTASSNRRGPTTHHLHLPALRPPQTILTSGL